MATQFYRPDCEQYHLFIIGRQPFFRLDKFHVHQSSGYTNVQSCFYKNPSCFSEAVDDLFEQTQVTLCYLQHPLPLLMVLFCVSIKLSQIKMNCPIACKSQLSSVQRPWWKQLTAIFSAPTKALCSMKLTSRMYHPVSLVLFIQRKFRTHLG